MANRKYTDDQRAEAIRLVSTEGHTAASVAREFSVSVGTVHRWVSDAQATQPAPLAGADAPGASKAFDEQQDLASQLQGVMHRIGRLETQIEQLSRRETGQEN